ncbi:hypothetical protein B0H34DRAFT_798666 [Crassisporium funariophilum]|nr:hypothetical protein B0H34DRAFT_798666 [Crassisporium funariophilum]
MVKLATSVLALALVATPALAVSSGKYYERNTEDILITRNDLEELFGREFVNDIEEREPFGLGFLIKGIRGAVKLGQKAHKAHEHVGHAQNNNQNQHKRALEELFGREFVADLEEREPFGLGFLIKGIRGAVKIGEKAHKGHKHLEHGQDNNQNGQKRRELEELYVREPVHLGHALKTAEHVVHHANNAYNSVNGRRSLEEEVYAREPIIRFGHAVQGEVHLAHHGTNEYHNNEGRELVIDDALLARYFYDDLD